MGKGSEAGQVPRSIEPTTSEQNDLVPTPGYGPGGLGAGPGAGDASSWDTRRWGPAALPVGPGEAPGREDLPCPRWTAASAARRCAGPKCPTSPPAAPANLSIPTARTPPRRVLMGPGPSDVDDAVLAAMARPTLGHLDPRFLHLIGVLARRSVGVVRPHLLELEAPRRARRLVRRVGDGVEPTVG